MAVELSKMLDTKDSVPRCGGEITFDVDVVRQYVLVQPQSEWTPTNVELALLKLDVAALQEYVCKRKMKAASSPQNTTEEAILPVFVAAGPDVQNKDIGECMSSAKWDDVHWTLSMASASHESTFQSLDNIRHCALASRALLLVRKDHWQHVLPSMGNIGPRLAWLHLQLLNIQSAMPTTLVVLPVRTSERYSMDDHDLYHSYEHMAIKRTIIDSSRVHLWGCAYRHAHNIREGNCCNQHYKYYPNHCRRVKDNGKKCLKTTPCCIHATQHLLYEGSRLFSMFNITHALLYGSVIGHFRCNGYNPFDYDHDIAVDQDQWKLKFPEILDWVTNNTRYAWFREHLTLLMFGEYDPKSGKKIPHPLHRHVLDVYQVKNLAVEKVKFDGVDLYIPNNWREHLIEWYRSLGSVASTEILTVENWHDKKNPLKEYSRPFKAERSCMYGDTSVANVAGPVTSP